MDYSKKLSLGSPVSFVLYPIDEYTGETVTEGSVMLYFPYFCESPIYKPDGSIVFCNFDDGEYKINILSEKYFTEELSVQLPISKYMNLIIRKSLKPSPAYPFQAGATLVRLSVIDRNGYPIIGIPIRCEISNCDFSRAKTARSAIKKGDKDFYVSSITGKISVGDCYLLKMGDEIAEECDIAEQTGDNRYFLVSEPFQNEHSRGSSLIPVIKTRTDQRGDAVIYFRSPPAKKFDVLINIGSTEIGCIKEITVEEGKTSYVGSITI
ncbi:hypothetical protein [Pseudobacteroides cellulosolvens]|uniref:hypothetical protein n=1 Tax=Pseudobacteroides cellulosolvens TaxID=35825 RepID=UPI0012B53D21|nr:hypothetical protein [Pseudobacteroides cellulosolvens]